MARKSLWLITFLSLATPLLAAHASASSTEYTIDPEQTVVSFEVKRLGLSRQSGEFSSVAGTVAMDVEAGLGSIEIAVDTRSVRADSETIESFLRGPGVLNVERYAEIAYKAQHMVFAGGKPERIDGELTLLGVTKPVTLTVERYICAAPQTVSGHQVCKLDATATFKRSEFGMNRYLAVVSDEVKLAIHGVAGTSVQE